MKRYVAIDGAVFAGSTAEEVVTSMRDRGFYPAASPSLKTYMMDVIERLSFFQNEPIDCSFKEHECGEFLRVLVDKGYFREVPVLTVLETGSV